MGVIAVRCIRMLLLILYILLGAVTLSAISLQKTYNHLPRRELKRRARAGDEIAKLLYAAAAYDDALQVFLWLIIGVGSSGFFVVVSRTAPAWAAMLTSLILLWLGFAWLPNTPISRFGIIAAKLVTAPLAWVLQKVFPLVSWFTRLTGRWRIGVHTGLYEKEDIIDLLHQQATQPDSRLSLGELQLAMNALTFGDKQVREIMIPLKAVKKVSTDDTAGPILMDELHASGHTSFPVYLGKKKSDIVGTLYLRDLLGVRAGEKIGDLMSSRVFYLHDETPLDMALQAFTKTKHHGYLVVNDFEDVVGLITLENILSYLIGHRVDESFDAYDDRHAVATRKGQKTVEELKTPTETEPEVVESHT